MRLKKRINRFKTVVNYFSNKPLFQVYPMEMAIELTDHCNLACVMCPHGIMDRPKGFMDFSIYKKIIDEIGSYTDFIHLFGIGESLLHKDLVTWIDYAADKGLTTSLSTNITYLDEAYSRRILNSKLDFMTLALDGGTKETYESIRVNGDFEQVVENIKTFLRVKRELGSRMDVTVQLILLEENWHEREKFLGLFTADERQMVSHFRTKPNWDNFRRSSAPIQHKRPCFYLWNLMSIFWDGKVPLCCIDYNNEYNLGDLAQKTVKEIWNSSRLENIRSSHSLLNVTDPKICTSCSSPEHGYFSPLNIMASSILSSRTIRKIMPWYEKIFMGEKWGDGPAGKTFS